MKFYIPLLVMTWLLIGCTNQGSKSKIIISGTVENSNLNEVLLSVNNKTLKREVKNGEFKFVLRDIETAFMTIKAKNEYRLYAEDGDHIILNIGDTRRAISFSGNGFEEAKYMKDRMQLWVNNGMVNQRLFEKKLFTMDFSAFNNKVTELYDKQIALLEEYVAQYEGFNPDFEQMDRKVIRYRKYYQLFKYPELYQKYNGEKADLPADYYDFVGNVYTGDTSLFEMNEYKSVVISFLEYETEKLTGPFENISEIEAIKARYDVIKNKMEPSKLSWNLSFGLLNTYIGKNGTEDIQDLYSDFIESCNDTNIINRIKTMHDSWNHLLKGESAPEFSMENLQGKNVKLSDYKGKLVYIMLWASYNPSHKREFPKLSELINSYSHPDLQYLTVSKDTNMKKWKSVLEQYGINIQNLVTKGTKHPFLDDYNAHRLPRYILIGKDGKIIDACAQSPDKIQDQLKELLQ